MNAPIKESLRPCDCESVTDLCSLKTSHKSVGNFDMMLQHDQAIIFTEHKRGEPCRASITIPKHIFSQMIAWYEAKQ